VLEVGGGNWGGGWLRKWRGFVGAIGELRNLCDGVMAGDVCVWLNRPSLGDVDGTSEGLFKELVNARGAEPEFKKWVESKSRFWRFESLGVGV
jgi:hypothetical protein